MPIAVLIIGTWFESKLRTILNAQFAAPYGSARGRQKRRRCLVDSIQQVLVPEGLGKELHRAGFHGLHRHRNISMPGDEDDGNPDARIRQLALKVQAVDARKSHVQNQATWSVRTQSSSSITNTVGTAADVIHAPRL